jgi:hypothetical protein
MEMDPLAELDAASRSSDSLQRQALVVMKLTSHLFQLQVLKIINTTAQVHAVHLSGAGIFYY